MGSSGWWFAGFLALLVAIVMTALQVVEASDDARTLYRELDAAQAQRNALAAEQSRLMLERSAWASLQNIETVALEQLNMVFPDQVEQVSR